MSPSLRRLSGAAVLTSLSFLCSTGAGTTFAFANDGQNAALDTEVTDHQSGPDTSEAEHFSAGAETGPNVPSHRNEGHGFLRPHTEHFGMRAGIQGAPLRTTFGDNWIPPGTLGQTYLRPSHPVPNDKHPRTAMLAVRNSIDAPILTVADMGGFRMKSGVWLFESSRPLDFGVSHVVRVEARTTTQEIEPYAVRYLRLIPGRIVYIDFAD